ncbi:MAG TPA: helix-turn-helix domain-containing protein, partial [Solirubrobacterales bacterium]|nr:helix-turn-helix domain-containing protein [Solirubrobacterales bacterium]
MATTAVNRSNGLVRPWEDGRSFVLDTRAPSPPLERLIDRHWMVRWDLRGKPGFRQETLPHPSLNLVIEPDGARVWGVPTQRDVRTLEGRGWAAGIKLRPGAFTAISGIAAAGVTDGSVPIPECLGGAVGPALIEAVDRDGLDASVAALEERLAPYADLQDPALDLVAAVVEGMRELPPDTKVEAIARANHLAPRTLQRLFHRYVGVGPKWVLARYRMHDAVSALDGGWTGSLTDLAHAHG